MCSSDLGQLDWIVAARRIFMAAGLDGADLVGSCVGGALAAELAALWPHGVRRLALIGPLGFWGKGERAADLFARRADEYPGLLCADPANYTALKAAPNDADPADWEIEQARAAEACARMLWPLGDTRLAKRLPLITQRTLLARGAADEVVSDRYLRRFGGAIAGETRIETIAGAGHLAELDRPRETARIILDFLEIGRAHV